MTLSNKIQQLIDAGRFTKVELSKMLGISRPTLDERLKSDNWKKLERQALLKLV